MDAVFSGAYPAGCDGDEAALAAGAPLASLVLRHDSSLVVGWNQPTLPESDVKDMDYTLIFYIIANLVITAGYLFVGFKIAPAFKVSLWYTKLGGVFFFFLCGMTHLEMAYHAWATQGVFHYGITPLTMIIHLPQAIAVWMFVLGLYKEFVIDADRSSAEDVPPQAPIDTDRP